MKKNRIFWLTVIVIIVLVLAGLYYKNQKASHSLAIDTQGQPLLGDKNAPNHIVVFEDLKCANCRLFNLSYFPQIKQKYIDTGKANYTLVLLAFIKGSIPAANTAYCMNAQNPEYYFQFIDYVYHHQPDETLDWATPNTLINFAGNINGVNLVKLQECMNNNTYYQQLTDNFDMAKKLMTGTVMTPSIYINGVSVNHLSMQNIERLM